MIVLMLLEKRIRYSSPIFLMLCRPSGTKELYIQALSLSKISHQFVFLLCLVLLVITLAVAPDPRPFC